MAACMEPHGLRCACSRSCCLPAGASHRLACAHAQNEGTQKPRTCPCRYPHFSSSACIHSAPQHMSRRRRQPSLLALCRIYAAPVDQAILRPLSVSTLFVPPHRCYFEVVMVRDGFFGVQIKSECFSLRMLATPPTRFKPMTDLISEFQMVSLYECSPLSGLEHKTHVP
jgi:hypothetical protein